MDQYLYKYLVLHKSLSIPQLGSFGVKNEPAYVEKTTGLLYAPKPVIYFSEGVIPMSEKQFFDFLAAEMGIDEVAAIKQFHDYTYRLRTDLSEQKKTTITGLGSLTKGEDDTVTFHPANDTAALMPAIPYATPVPESRPAKGGTYTTTVEEEYVVEETRDRWWVYALILLAAGSAALLLYYN